MEAMAYPYLDFLVPRNSKSYPTLMKTCRVPPENMITITTQ